MRDSHKQRNPDPTPLARRIERTDLIGALAHIGLLLVIVSLIGVGIGYAILATFS